MEKGKGKGKKTPAKWARTRNTVAAAAGCSLPLDLINQVLLRLPLKCLLRFECVSKEWYNLISSSSFRNLYYINHKSFCLFWELIHEPKKKKQSIHVQVIDLHDKNTPTTFFSDFKFNITRERRNGKLFQFKDIYYATSCNGLVCFANECRRESQVLVINPMRRNYVLRLPPPPDHLDEFSHSSGTTRICIGFLPSTNQFKIVCLHHFCFFKRFSNSVFDSEIRSEILTLTDAKPNSSTSSPTWKNVAKSYRYRHSLLGTLEESQRNIPLCVNGVMYWLMPNTCIVALDLETEEFRFIPTPNDLSFTTPNIFLGKVPIYFTELRGCLCLLYGYDIWLLHKKESEYHWAPKLGIHLTCVRPPAKMVVHMWNAKSGKSQYYLVNENNEKPIQICGDDDDDTRDELVIMPNRCFWTQEQILFQGSLLSLNSWKYMRAAYMV